MAAIRELVRRSRVVTLTGAAGAGKSRLAIRCAQDLLADFEDGVYFVPLAAVGEADLVAPSIARAIGLDLDPGRATDEQLVAALRERETLLVLDNFEHLLAAASIVATIVASAPRVRVLVTSRAKLRVSGEREFAVDPLPVPGPAGSGDLERLTDYGAVALFVDRAMAVNPAFRLDAANAAAVVAICRRLDGLPLAIELAAARSALLPPDALLTRLEGGLAVLSGGARDLPDRHRTLRHAIAWSVDLLSSSEQALFRRLAAFVDGFDLPAVDAVSNRSEELGLDTLDGLTALTEASLVRQVAASGEPRFAMLTTVRDFGLERLREAGDLDALTLRHAWYFLDLAERGLAGLQGEGRVRWMDRIELDRANLRAALQWAIDADEPRWGGQIAAALFEWAEGRLAMPRLPA
jgi:predicted ATPase